MATIAALHQTYEASQAIYTTCYCVLRQKRFLISRFLRTKEQKARLQCLVSAMLKSVIPSGARYDKVSKKKRKNLAVLANTPRLKCFFFSAKLSSSNVEMVALTRAPENVVENHDISFEALFTLRLAGRIDMLFSGVFVCNLCFLLIVRVNVVSCRVTLW